MIKADQSQMHQVLLNLCTNAAQALPQGGVIAVGLQRAVVAPGDPQAPPNLRPGVYQMLWVKDSGQGMDQATLARIFDPFFTTKEPGVGHRHGPFGGARHRAGPRRGGDRGEPAGPGLAASGSICR